MLSLVDADVGRRGATRRRDIQLRCWDCALIRLGDKDRTEAVHMRVLGKHSRGGKREDAYGMFGAVSAFKAMKAARPTRSPTTNCFSKATARA